MSKYPNRPNDQGSSTCTGNKGTFFASPTYPDPLRGPPTPLYNGNSGLFLRT